MFQEIYTLYIGAVLQRAQRLKRNINATLVTRLSSALNSVTKDRLPILLYMLLCILIVI